MGIILFVLGFIFLASLTVAFIYTLPKLMIIGIIALAMYYIIDSIRIGRWD